jgi:hypothetical protein
VKIEDAVKVLYAYGWDGDSKWYPTDADKISKALTLLSEDKQVMERVTTFLENKGWSFHDILLHKNPVGKAVELNITAQELLGVDG